MRYYITEPGYVIAAAILLSLLDIIAVSLRFWARKKQRELLKVDDWLMLPATIQWTFDLMLPLAFGCIKASFLFFYRRIFVVDKKSITNYVITGLVIIVGLSSAGFFFASLFQCRLDFSALWGSTIEIVENCVDTMHLVLSVCIAGFILDLIIITTPMPLIWQLNLSFAKKISVVGIFLLGSVIVASLLRLINLARLVSQGFSPDVDGLLVVTQYLYWGVVESGVGIIAACLPTLQFLIRKHYWKPAIQATKKIFSFKGSSNSSRSGYVESNPARSDEEIEAAPLKALNENVLSVVTVTMHPKARERIEIKLPPKGIGINDKKKDFSNVGGDLNAGGWT
ncbi:hypothetical protein GQX73_g5751 [Xylaria multiplex]|uniref:Rhodopsin domain-containing protein n=1 Tax=Xylaria multiplex TaxID=323545 RepID=A0A7C8MTR8_9PEZI|nr:hypothetical protein GQX73_g5751 [Xylaria multiplex]